MRTEWTPEQVAAWLPEDGENVPDPRRVEELETQRRDEASPEQVSSREPEVCGGTGNHDGQPVDCCDECHAWVYSASGEPIGPAPWPIVDGVRRYPWEV